MKSILKTIYDMSGLSYVIVVFLVLIIAFIVGSELALNLIDNPTVAGVVVFAGLAAIIILAYVLKSLYPKLYDRKNI